LLIGAVFGSSLVTPLAFGQQQIQFPSSSAGAAPGTLNNPWGGSPPAPTGTFPPGSGVSGWPPPPTNLGTPALSSPAVSIRPNSSPVLPQTYTGAPVAPLGNYFGLGNLFGSNAPPVYGAPNPYGPPPNYPINGVYPGNSTAFPNSYPQSVYPNAAPPTLYPGSFGTSTPNPQLNQQFNPYGQPYGTNPGATNIWNPNTWQTPNGPMLNNSFTNDPLGYTSRFFVTPRFRHSWINGSNDPNALEINDSEVSFLFQIPRWLGSTQPLYMAPSFAIHLWDGPSNGTADLPGSAYSALLDFGWETNPTQTFGLETGVRVGVFTDFNTFNGDSLRIQGKILGRARLTPNATARIGAYWLDRNRIKLLPAIGILWTPNADTRFDLFFPEPKLSHYLTTVGNRDAWWYVTGYYGGGAWTIQRDDSTSDDIDLNDIRVCIGLEWGRNDALRLGQRFAFFEGGYAFDRELIYRVRPANSIDLENSFVLRAGFIY